MQFLWSTRSVLSLHWLAAITIANESRICAQRLLMARRVFPDAPNHKLGTLVNHLRLPMNGQFHRALADAEATAHLFIKMQQRIQERLGCAEPSCRQLLAVQRQKIGTF